MSIQLEDIWGKIKKYADKNINQKQNLLSGLGDFYIVKSDMDYIKIDKLAIKLQKAMFLSTYEFIKEKKNWIKIGATRVNTDPTTIEGFIKKTYFKNNPNALSTAPWFSAILVYSNIGIIFNERSPGQALKYKANINVQ